VQAPLVTTATPADRDRVVTTVVAAFVADPAFRYFFPEDSTYAENAPAFAGWLFDRRVHSGGVWVAGGGAAVSMWEKSVDAPSDPLPLVLAADAQARLDQYDHEVHGLLPRDPHWYLGVLATHPDHAGQRLGRAVMAAGLARAAADGLHSVLETTNPDNVGLYRRGGWEVVEQVVVDGSLTVWVMSHPPGD
jgi:ribosomal protein S18 acetylase RimI-like enzyme